MTEFLMICIKIGNIECIKQCIENRADVHAADDYALRWASHHGHYDVVKLLLENGADVHARYDSALMSARVNGHYDVVKLLENYARK